MLVLAHDSTVLTIPSGFSGASACRALSLSFRVIYILAGVHGLPKRFKISLGILDTRSSFWMALPVEKPQSSSSQRLEMDLTIKQSPDDFCLHRPCHRHRVVCGRGPCEMGISVCLSALSSECISGSEGMPLSRNSYCCGEMPGGRSSPTSAHAEARWHNQNSSSTVLAQLRREHSMATYAPCPPQGWLFCPQLPWERGTGAAPVSCVMLGHCTGLRTPASAA